ncbi:MAG: hypothetical protein LBQ54_06515 [Planctomycetaceae bacterium]|nr:hypothetical protein [Planctomycetaceae bacterium]
MIRYRTKSRPGSPGVNVTHWIAIASRDRQYAFRLRGRLPMDNLSSRLRYAVKRHASQRPTETGYCSGRQSPPGCNARALLSDG